MGLGPLERIRAVGHLGGPVDDVLAAVAVLGRLLAGFAGGERRGECLHLHAAVVDVELVGDVVADEAQQPGQAVAVDRAAGVTGVHRAGRVGRHVLDHHPGAGADVAAAVVGTGVDDGADQVVQPRRVQAEVDEAGPGDLDRGDVAGRVRGERVGELLGELAGVATGGLGGGHGDVGGELAVLAPGRSLEVDLGGGVDAEGAEGAEGVPEGGGQHVTHGAAIVPPASARPRSGSGGSPEGGRRVR